MNMFGKIKRLFQMPLSRKIQVVCFLFLRLRTNMFYRFFMKSCGNSTLISKPIFWTPEYIKAGNHVMVWNGNRIEAVSEYANEKFLPEIVLEDGVVLQQYCHVTAAGRLVIGKGTTVLQYVVITDIDHEYESLDISPALQRLNVKETKIGENCFIGAGARILSGTTLGDHCIVGANAVVKGQFPSGCVIAGIPARIIKKYDPVTQSWLTVDKN